MALPARLAAVLMALLLGAGSASAQVSAVHGRTWLRVVEPVDSEVEVDLPLVDVGGYAGARGVRGQDLVIVIDLSDSTTEPSGADLDGDGPDGTTSPQMIAWLARQPDAKESLVRRLQREDFDDSVLMAELSAAYVLVDSIDPELFRLGIVAFSGHGWLVAPVGSSREELHDALDYLRWYFFQELSGTNFVDAIRVATAALVPNEETVPLPDEALPDRESRARSILFLSDGAPTGGTGRRAAEAGALEAARIAADHDVRLYTYALGPQAIQALDIYRGMAELTGGRFEKIERPGDAIVRLRMVDFADVADIRVENLTTGDAARAIRSFPDGSFDGLVELAQGENQLRFTAVGPQGAEDVAERTVRFTEPTLLAEGSPEALEWAEREREMLERLRNRTREVEVFAEMGTQRPPQGREVEVRASRQRREVAAPPPGS